MQALENDLTERCVRCNVLRYFDLSAGERTEEGYLCTGCVRQRDGKRRPTQQELQRFLDDPDEMHRLEQRIKDLEVIVVAAIAAQAKAPEKGECV